MMSKRVESLKESPCYQCGKQLECFAKADRSPKLWDIVDLVFANAEFDYNNCTIFKAFRLNDIK